MNYSELVAATIAYADRYDAEVSDNMDTFILLTEARINRLLKTREQSTRAYTPTVADEEFYSLPPDWAGMRDIQLTNPDPKTVGNSVQSFNLLDPKMFDVKRGKPYDGMLYYTVIAKQIQIYPIQDIGCTIEMVYYQKVPPLSVSATSNWVSEDHPDIYLAGMTAEVSLFAKDYDTAQTWYNRLGTAVDELENVDLEERWSGDAPQIRLG